MIFSHFVISFVFVGNLVKLEGNWNKFRTILETPMNDETNFYLRFHNANTSINTVVLDIICEIQKM